jgi:PleD family two-component response regulator
MIGADSARVFSALMEVRMAGDEIMPPRTDQAAIPTILVVAHDPMLLKLLEKALKLELACQVLAMTRGSSAVEIAKSVRPDLVIIDAHLLDCNALELPDQLHAIKEMESVPTLLLNAPGASGSEIPGDHTSLLGMPFVLVEFYAAVHHSLDRT